MNAQEVEAAGGHTAGSAARGYPEYAPAASKSSMKFDCEKTQQTARSNREATNRKFSVFPIELRKLLLQVGKYWQIVDLNVGTIQVMLQVVLLIAFRGIESL